MVAAASWPKTGKKSTLSGLRRAATQLPNLGVGHWVEFELQYGFERPRAVNIKQLGRDAG
ncbi:MAG: hypothetical protein DMG97_28370 [Acidobacteria bacterium]|nr:MAG: hypothetical protein DMG97_28370 [Acidobacteriota bacterium]